MMTRKDYRVLARAIGRQLAECERQGVDMAYGGRMVLFGVVSSLRQDNPRFDAEAFYGAVDVERESQRQADHDELCDAFRCYVDACEAGSCDALTFQHWQIQGCPMGPLG